MIRNGVLLGDDLGRLGLRCDTARFACMHEWPMTGTRVDIHVPMYKIAPLDHVQS